MKMCQNLRWKAFYGKRWASVEELESDLMTADSPFSCLLTCQGFGPDGDLAAPETCDDTRRCFHPSNRVPAARTVS